MVVVPRLSLNGGTTQHALGHVSSLDRVAEVDRVAQVGFGDTTRLSVLTVLVSEVEQPGRCNKRTSDSRSFAFAITAVLPRLNA